MALLVPLYNSPQRHYHDLNHINYCLSKLSEYMDENPELINVTEDIVKHAIWYHDAVYSPYPFGIQTSNEIESATLFRESVYYDIVKTPSWDADHGHIFMDAVNQAILATEHHLNETAGIMVGHMYPTTKIMLDIDLAGFSKPFNEVYKDSDRIFKEYECLGLPKRIMLENRVKFLKAMLAKEYIFYTEYFHKKYEKTARSNIQAVIELSEVELETIE